MKPWYSERDCPFCTRSASSFCHNPLFFLAHAMWVKWWYDANFQPFQSTFEMLFNFRVLYLKIFSKCMKNNKWSQRGLKIDDVALNGAFWTQKNYGVQISSRKWNPFVTDEFPYETLILRKRLSVLYTKCIQLLPETSLLSCTCYVCEMMTPCQLSTFSEFICSAFQFQGLTAQNNQ